jgi:hypothetical protein
MRVEQRRALRLLAGAPNGATEAIMLAHGFATALLDGFTYTMLDTLVRDGLATAEQREMRAGAAADQGYLADDHRGRTAGTGRMMALHGRTARGALRPFIASTNQSMSYHDAVGHANQCNRRKESKMNQAAYDLMFDAFHHNDMPPATEPSAIGQVETGQRFEDAWPAICHPPI